MKSEVALNIDLLTELSLRWSKLVIWCRANDHSTSLFTSQMYRKPTVKPVGLWRGRPPITGLLVTFFKLLKDVSRCDMVIAVGPGVVPTIALIAGALKGIPRRKRCYLVNAEIDQALMGESQGSRGSKINSGVVRLLHHLSISLAGLKVGVSRAISEGNDWFVMPEISRSQLSESINYSVPQKDREVGSVLFAGRLAVEKGLLEFMDSLPHITSLKQLRIIGDGPLMDFVQSKIRGLKNIEPEEVNVAGNISRAALLEQFGRAQVVVVPSKREGFGLVAFEAGVMGCHVVASSVGGLPEALQDLHVTWWTGGARDLAIAIDRALSCAELGDRHRIDARYKLSEEYALVRGWLTPRTLAQLLEG